MFTATGPVDYQPRPPAFKIDESSKPWTTARCHRLLRPLISRIASLRKDALINSQTSAPTSRSDSGIIAGTSAGGSGTESDIDSELLGPRKKRPRRTYSQRRGARVAQPQTDDRDQTHLGQSGHGGEGRSAFTTKPVIKRPLKCIRPEARRDSMSPGKIVAATPALRRARGETVISPMAPVPKLDLSTTQAELGRGPLTRTGSGTQKRSDERLTSLRDNLPSKYADLEAIYRSLEALLKATTLDTPNDVRRTKGPRSLLDMCLRRVPQYITELEAWEKLEAEQSGTISTLDSVDTSAEIYNYLESLGTNRGWRHLRVVVRADGLTAVKHAIEDRLFEDEFSALLIDLCVQLGAASEAEELLTALVNRQYPQPTSTGSRFTPKSASQLLLLLNKFADKTQLRSVLFRQYTMLLSSGNLPADWLATTEFEPVWGLAVQTIAKSTPSYDAINFIMESVVLLSSRKRTLHGAVDTAQRGQAMAKASQRTLMSALAILASMAVLGEAEIESASLSESDLERIMFIGDRLRYILRACIHSLGSYERGLVARRLEFLYLALFFSSGETVCETTRNRVRADIGRLSSVIDTSLSTKDARIRGHYDSIAWLIASIARDCSRGMSAATHKCLDRLFDRLKSLKLDRQTLDNLKAAAAFLVAQQTNNVRDLIYAENLHSHDRSSFDAAGNQQSGNALFTGYRWDETIGEWVTISPEAKKHGKAITKKRTRSAPELDTDITSVQSTKSKYPIPSKHPVIEPRQDHEGTNSRKNDLKGDIRLNCIEHGTVIKKRTRHLQNNETLSTMSMTNVPPLEESLATSSSSMSCVSQLDPDKENRVSWLAKKPRRSSGRIILAARPPSRYSLGGEGMPGQENVCSDDELCT
jgi:hypothetical protein